MNAILRYEGQARGKRMASEAAFTALQGAGFTQTAVVRVSVARDGRRETVVTDWHNAARGYVKARLTVTYSI
jgi:hypothetical protein